MPFVLEDLFADCGRDLADFVDLRPIDPLCRFFFADGATLSPGADTAATRAAIGRLHAPDAAGFDRFMARHRRLMKALQPCLAVPFDKPWHLARPALLKALPLLDLPKSYRSRLGDFFADERVRAAFAFPSPFLGASPDAGTAAFGLLPYAAQRWGVHHPAGGCNALSAALEKLARALGARFLFGADVAQIDTEGSAAKALRLADGARFSFDDIVMNADAAWGLKNLLPAAARRKPTDARLDALRLSPSAFVMHLGVAKRFPHLSHHNIFLSADPAKNFHDLDAGRLSDDPSFYLQNASPADPTLAPDGHSALYVLAPVPNLKGNVDWSTAKEEVRRTLYRKLAERAGLKGLEAHVRVEKITTPADWAEGGRAAHGAVFNFAHTPGQMFFGRPHNKLDGFDNLWLVGGGTHPGNGLPLIYLSGRIAADGIARKHRARPALRIPLPRAVRLPLPAPAPVPSL